MRVSGHKALTGVNSQSIDDGRWTDCSCGQYTGPICRTKEESRERFEQDQLAKLEKK
jgi:hypothetical protein